MLKGIFSKPYSRLFIVGDNSGWSTDIDALDLKKFADKLGIKASIVRRAYLNIPQVVHYTSQFSLLLDIYKSKHHLSLDYYHGKPEQDESFRKCFKAIGKHHEQIGRIRVSTRKMEGLIKTTGIDPVKIMRIPIGIDLEIFHPQTSEEKRMAREKLGIPQEAYVIGSFQKDGVGWGEGMEPKFIKGPDIFLKVIENLKSEIENLFVLLSGPSRGFMKAGLEKIGIPYRHLYFKDYKKITDLYDALDLYLITSREEGGPKACLESMAKGVPLVTTEVGQTKDLVKSGENAMMAQIDDVESLIGFVKNILNDGKLRSHLVKNGFKTATENSFESQLPLWRNYFNGLL